MAISDTVPEDVVATARGAVPPDDLDYARQKVASVTRVVREPVRFAKVELVAHADPARERPVFAKAELDVDGTVVRAHATASSAHEAADLLQERLRERIDRHDRRQRSLHRRQRDRSQWHHGDEVTVRHEWFPRPDDEREVVRRKTFAVEARTAEQAASDLEELDHDFYLFTDAETGDDAVVQRLGEERYALVHPTPLDLDQAIERLETSGDPFTFFLDPGTGRGAVLYHRYDGHYGLITSADGAGEASN